MSGFYDRINKFVGYDTQSDEMLVDRGDGTFHLKEPSDRPVDRKTKQRELIRQRFEEQRARQATERALREVQRAEAHQRSAPLYAFLNSVASGATGNLDDYFAAGMATVTGLDGEFGFENFQDNLDHQRERDRIGLAQHPRATAAGEAIGKLLRKRVGKNIFKRR